MALYNIGTISVTNGSATVALTGATLTDAMLGGLIIMGSDTTYYRLLDATTISPVYTGVTNATATYQITYGGVTPGLALQKLTRGLVGEDVVHNYNLDLLGTTIAAQIGLHPLYAYNFNSGVDGWTGTDATLANVANSSYISYTSTASTHLMASPTLAIPDADTWNILVMRYRLASGQTEFPGTGIINFTGASGDSPWNPDTSGGWAYLILDLTNDIKYAADWDAGSIVSLSIGFPNQTYTSGVVWHIDTIALCQYGFTGLASGSSGTMKKDLAFTHVSGNTFTIDGSDVFMSGSLTLNYQGSTQKPTIDFTEVLTSGYITGVTISPLGSSDASKLHGEAQIA